MRRACQPGMHFCGCPVLANRTLLSQGRPPRCALQYPRLRASVEADLATMLILADAGHWLFPATSWRWLFEELQK